MPKTKERRTQDERSAETRQKLLDATIRSLVDFGYPATTGRRVAELAGVSRGAQTHHYPQMSDLISDAVEHLAERRAKEFERRAADLRGTGEEVSGLVDLLWEDYSSDLFKAVVKLWVAAADDPALSERLTPLERSLRSMLRSTVRSLVGDAAGPGSTTARLDLVVNAVRGLALAEAFEPGEGRSQAARWRAIRPLLIGVLEGLGGPRS
jgi:DNA-binding transcriptional regulator YbjK